MTKGEEAELQRVVSRLDLTVSQLERKVERMDETIDRLERKLDAAGADSWKDRR